MKTSLLRHFLFVMLVAGSFPVIAQQTGAQPRLTHHLSPAEALLRHTIGRNFIITDPPQGNVFSLGEFERNTGVLIAYSGEFGIPTTLIREMARDAIVTTLVSGANQENTVRNIYSNGGVNLDNCQFIYAPTNSYWTRDYGPWYIAYGDDQIGVVDFPYNRPRPADDEVPVIVANALGLELFGMNVIQTGGNYMSTGLGAAAATTLVWDENPGQTHAQINQKTLDYLGVNNYHVVEDPNNTYIDHIDCWSKFLAPDKVMVRSVPTTHPQYNAIEAAAAYFAAQVSPYGTPYKVYRVNTPQNQPYSNSFILNDKVFVPITNSTYDAAALESYRNAMPGYKVYGYLGLGSAPWESTDALHCRTHEMADRNMLRIRHLPYSGNVAPTGTYAFTATVTPYSKQGVYADSVLLYYRINPGPNTPYQVKAMSPTMGKGWSASIESPEYGSTVQYYLFAADSSGRREFHPFIGEPDAHEFYVGEQLFAQLNTGAALLEATAMKDTYTTVELALFNEGNLSLNYEFLADTRLRDTLHVSLTDSPGAKNYNFNTLTEKGWTTVMIDSTGNLDQLVVQYNWITDVYPVEGSLWAQAPSGNSARLATGQNQGSYVLKDTQLFNESIAGAWKFWIQDSNGDGGHQAKSVSVGMVRGVSTSDWLSADIQTGTIAAGESQTITITCDASGLEPGNYQGTLRISSNDPDAPVKDIPVYFTVTINTAVQQNATAGIKLSVYPNPASDQTQLEIIADNAREVYWTIADLNGRSLQQGKTMLQKGYNKVTLDISALKAGLYLLKAETSAGNAVLKLVKGK